jgi:tRNA threonylcarbamoyladenosine biosynthesis protein TsaE
MQIQCLSLNETLALGRSFAPILKVGDIVTLTGTLGAGKTAFARSLIQQRYGADIEVPSPTFNLLLTYELPSEDTTLYHYDLYRVENPEEVWELDVEDAFEFGISLIEWPDRMGKYLPKDHLEIRIEALEGEGTEGRILKFFGDKSWKQRLDGFRKVSNAG